MSRELSSLQTGDNAPMKWFVYDNSTYYPSAVIVEAATPEAAIEAAGHGEPEAVHGIAVFPLDSLALWRHLHDESITTTLEPW